MQKKIIVVLAILLAFVMVYLVIPSNSYLRKAIIHGNVNIDDYNIFENRIIAAGNPQPWPISKNFNRKIIPKSYNAFLAEFKTVAFIVIKNDSVLHESYFNNYNQNSLSNSFSAAKSIISLLVGIALDEGSIKSLDEPVYNYFPEYKNEQNNKLTIRQVLTMSSGLNWDEAYSSPFSLTTKAYYGNNLRKLIADLKVTDEPGKRFKYLSGNTQLLAFILEKATGKHVADYASEKLWRPLGACNDALWCLDEKDGMEKAYCCFNSNALDFARIGQLVLNKGRWNGKQVISEKYIEEATSPAKWIQDEWGSKPLDYYGYQWWITSHNGKKVVYARGILGQYIFVIPEEKLVIVRLGEKRSKLRTGNLPSDIYLWLNLGSYLAKK
jgi:CubicO group peptidase (beta-lactamase class C family)